MADWLEGPVDASNDKYVQAVNDALDEMTADLAAPAGPQLAVLPVVGLQELGRMFGVSRHTPYQWRTRKILPENDDTISGNPVWRLPTIYAWAVRTGRTIVWDPWKVVAPRQLEEVAA